MPNAKQPVLGVSALIQERGLLPRKSGKPRCDEMRVRELRWQMERFAEIIAWDSYIAGEIMEGKALFHFYIMVMRQETGQYDAEGGDDLYTVDAVVQHRLDPTVDVRRYADQRPPDGSPSP